MSLSIIYIDCMLRLRCDSLTFADQTYRYEIIGCDASGRRFWGSGLTSLQAENHEGVLTIRGQIAGTPIALTQVLRQTPDGVEETIALENQSREPVSLENIRMGFAADLAPRQHWRLVAIPFRVQLEVPTVRDYTGSQLAAGLYMNPVVHGVPFLNDGNLTEPNVVRSEAWAWGTGDQGILIAKYNNHDIELSVAGVDRSPARNVFYFGGVGFSLFGEPSPARTLAGGSKFTFGTTHYQWYEGGLNEAFYTYRRLISRHGHGFPADYNPPVNWNELYDIGWHHSDPQQLKKYYNKETLLREAQKAHDCHCELLYLDPGWEKAEGATEWDESRLGTVRELAATLRERYQLGLGFRSILQDHTYYWPKEMVVQHDPANTPPAAPLKGAEFQEICFCNPAYWDEKLRRILAIAGQGVTFMMIDEFEWRGPCYDPRHGHAVPTTAQDHVLAVYRLCKEIRKACPKLTIECHDPVWPWNSITYVPTYFHQGFGERGDYDENWGFEFMWNVIDDMRSGKALALYYYNLASNVPLYLHISMGTDNDACLFFWWAASTVRHLGIGGKDVQPTAHWGKLAEYDSTRRFDAYSKHMARYQQLKPYFVRGAFYGISEDAHLHTLPGRPGGVLNLFNLTDQTLRRRVRVPAKLLGGHSLRVDGAVAEWEKDAVIVCAELPPLSPAVVTIGDMGW